MMRARRPRGVYTTTRVRPKASIPSVTKRGSPSASGSSTVTPAGSLRACSACAKLTRCLRRLSAALSGSNSMFHYAYPICIMQVANAAPHDARWKAQTVVTFDGSARELSCRLIRPPVRMRYSVLHEMPFRGQGQTHLHWSRRTARF
jgi:hypothetical protein